MKSFLKFIQTRRALRKRIKQRATWFSLVVVLLLFGLFLEAYMHNFNLVYITLFFVFALAFTSAFMSMENIGYLQADFLHKVRFFKDTQTALPVSITNPLEISSWGVNLGDGKNSIALGELKAKSKKVVPFLVTPLKRGKFIYNELAFDSKFPLSTAHLFMKVPNSLDTIVYPAPKGKPLVDFLQESLAYYGDDKEFDGISSYDGTQKLSHIHWASVAKGELSVKKFIKETQSSQLLFNFYKSAKDDEMRLSQLCLWVLECEKQHIPFSIEMPKKNLHSTKESIDEILTYLAKY